MNAKKIVFIATGLALAASMALAIPAFAATEASVSESSGGWNGQGYSQLSPGHANGQGLINRGQGMMRSGVSGTVTAVAGYTITVSGRQSFGSTTPAVSYTVNAANAAVRKNNATSTVSSISVGDMIFAQGTVTGTNVTATMIFDGVTGRMGDKGSPGKNGQDNPGHATSTLPFVGNGQPVIAGTVSAINGTSLTLTTTSNVIYAVDASSAKILQGQNTITLSGLAVGNTVLVQGAVNGTSVTATTIVDQHAPASATPAQAKGQPHGFFGSIGQFFMHLFGF